MCKFVVSGAFIQVICSQVLLYVGIPPSGESHLNILRPEMRSKFATCHRVIPDTATQPVTETFGSCTGFLPASQGSCLLERPCTWPALTEVRREEEVPVSLPSRRKQGPPNPRRAAEVFMPGFLWTPVNQTSLLSVPGVPRYF